MALLMIGGEFDLSAGVAVTSSALCASLFSYEFTAVFDEVLADIGMRIIKTPVRSPRANSFCGAVRGNATA